jgi:tRNA (guanine10-N2)-dimethyltransferase
MILIFELSKEHKTLPTAEVLASLEAEHTPFTVIDSTEDVLTLKVKSDDYLIRRLEERLAFTYVIDELTFSCHATIDTILQNAEQHPLKQNGSIAIRCNNRSSTIDSQNLIDGLGDIYTKHRPVNLTNPDIELRALLTKNTAYIGIKKATIPISHFQQRRGHLRPFLSPITLHPKIARAMVNLSHIYNRQTLLDPFCGTGGILLEAGLIGAHIIGGDVEQKMIDGCRQNLEFYHLKNYMLYCTDIGNISQYISSVDAIVTDFPYARATTTKGEGLIQLYTRAFELISHILKKNGRAVIGLSSEEILSLGTKYLSLIEFYPVKSHRSLTRYFVVYKNS